MTDERKTETEILDEPADLRQKQLDIKRALRENQSLGRTIFDHAPAPLWEADFSALKKEIDRLGASETRRRIDLLTYVHSHPEVLRDLISKIRILAVNTEALRLHDAPLEEPVVENLHALIPPESYDLLARQFSLIAEGATTAELEGRTTTIGGEPKFVRVKWIALPGYEGTLGRVLLSVTDLTARKRLEDDLRESEEKFRTLFDKSPDGVFLLEGETCIDCNQGALTLRRCETKEQIVGQNVPRRAPERQPDGTLSSEKARQHHETLLRNGFNRFEWVGSAFDGTPTWVEVSQTLVRLQGRQITYSVAREIGERKRAEARLQESEERYRMAIEHSNDAVAIVRGQTHIYVNQRFLEMFGYDRPEEIIGKEQDIVVHPDDQAMAAEYNRKRQSGETAPSRYEFTGVRKDGTTIHGEVSAAAITFLGEPAVLSFLRDITDRKRAEEALKESEERYRTVVESSPTGILIHLDGRIEYANRAWMRMAGVESLEELYGKNVLDFVPPATRGIIEERMRVIETEKTRSSWLEHKLARPDGSFTEIASSGVPFTHRGRTGVMAFVEDITQRKAAEGAVKVREKELENKSMSLEEANIALKVLLKHRDEDKCTLENTILSNVKELVFPYLDKLKRTHASDTQMAYLGVIESSLNDVISPFLRKITNVYSHFTPAEIHVADLVRKGKTSKEVADLLNVSGATVHVHRDRIRRKLGLSKKKVNLQTYLLSLQT